MGLFKNMFKSTASEEENALPWIALNNLEQLDEIVDRSKGKPQLIFKHSTRCHISQMVIKQFTSSYDFTVDDADLYYLDLLNYREISNEISTKFQVWHESPQLLVVKNGEVVAHASHGAINTLDLVPLV